MASVLSTYSHRCAQASLLGSVVLAAVLTGCASRNADLAPDTVIPVAPSPAPLVRSFDAIGEAPSGSVRLSAGASAQRAVTAPEIITGTGRFANPGAAPALRGEPILTGSDVTLNFTGADVRDVLQSVLGDLLRVSYAVDPAVQGTVTLQTGQPIPRSSVINVLSSALQLSGVALVQRDGLLVAVPVASAVQQAPLGGGTGFVTQVATPRYVSAEDLERVLQPLVPPNTTVKADPARNLLIVSGNARDVATVIDNVAVFDVDAMRGMSFALMPLRNARARDIATEVTTLLASSGRAMAGTVKILPLERMNAVIVTAMQPAYLQRVQNWVERLDRGDGRADQRLFVYRVQNGRATDIARVLRQALGLQGETGAAPGAPPLAPGLPAPVTGLAAPTPIDNLLGRSANAPGDAGAPARTPDRNEPLASVTAAAALASGGRPPPVTEVRVTPDDVNNALIITGSAQEYAPIEAALQKLDIAPLQVLIEATVAEVTLNDELRFGLQYFFRSGNFAGIFAPNVATGTGSTLIPPFGSTFPGFPFLSGANFAYAAGESAAAVLQLLSRVTNVRVLSSPNLMVRNNGSARLQVGDQVPIATQSATSTLTNTAQTVNAIDYRDTGIILNVTPRVNASGLVLLDISEEVSQAAETSSSTLNSPTISQRRVSSTVAVHDGQTIALAGLIRDEQDNTTAGLPILKDVPVVGLLFGTRGKRLRRTELIVLITPRVIRSRDDGDAITRELREKMRLTIPVAAGRR